MRTLGYSERRICKALGISRNTVRYVPQPRDDEDALTDAILHQASTDATATAEYTRCYALRGGRSAMAV